MRRSEETKLLQDNVFKQMSQQLNYVYIERGPVGMHILTFTSLDSTIFVQFTRVRNFAGFFYGLGTFCMMHMIVNWLEKVMQLIGVISRGLCVVLIVFT